MIILVAYRVEKRPYIPNLICMSSSYQRGFNLRESEIR